MAEIITATISDTIAELPQLVPWNRDRVGTGIDLLVVCAGFEERAASIVRAIDGIAVRDLLIIEYPTNETENAAGLDSLRQIKAMTTTSIRYQRHCFFRDISEFVARLGTGLGHRVVVDVSAMASYVTTRLLKAIWESCGGASLGVFYAEADQYHPTFEEWNGFFATVTDTSDNLAIAERYEETYFQARGVSVTYECDAFPGHNEGPLAAEMIAIPSFSLQRVKSMTTFAGEKYNVSPSDLSWFLGLPPDKPKNGWRFEALAKLYNVKSGGVAVDTRDYRDVLRKLDEAWSEALCNERHLMIGGMGSKMQNIGVFLFLLMHPECGLLHCEPSEFIASRYTSGVGPIWWIDFNDISATEKMLKSRGSLKFRW